MRQPQQAPHLDRAGRPCLLTGGHRSAHTQREKSGAENPPQQRPGFKVPAHIPAGREREPRTGYAHTLPQPFPISNPPPGRETFGGPYSMPRAPKNEKKFPRSAAAENRPRAPGPDYAQNRGPTGGNIPRSYKHAGGEAHDTDKGNTRTLLRMLRRQQERGPAMPCGKLPPTPLPNGPQAETGRRCPGRP